MEPDPANSKKIQIQDIIFKSKLVYNLDQQIQHVVHIVKICFTQQVCCPHLCNRKLAIDKTL